MVLTMHTTYRCYRCDYETQQHTPQCPQCGYRLLTIRGIQRLGWVLVVLGVLLVVFMGAVTLWATQIVFFPSPGETTGFTGGPQVTILIFSILYTVLMFGFICIGAGIWQIRHGRRNRKLVHVIGVLALMMFAIAMLIDFFG